ncbi:MAG: N-acetylglucosamine kinase [Bacteroidia bacterium]|jgi:N-acetylglucosamine kinase-like BadF-type ATPase
MKLLVDSGATKADWIALDDQGNRLFTTQTLGLSPEVINKEEALERLEARFDIYNNRKDVSNLFFYGAGCGTDRMKTYMTNVFKEFFPNAEVVVKEDTYAAAYATNPSNEKAIICILGTGSNCSYFDGEELIQKVQSLGYIAMDDCSGNRFGRDLIRAYYFNKMPQHLSEKFASEFNLEPDYIKHNLYKEPNPNAFLATFAKFLIQNKEEAFIKTIITNAMQSFVDNYILQFDDAREVPVHFVGSIAFYLKAELGEVLSANGLTLGNVLRRPIDGLIEYHELN